MNLDMSAQGKTRKSGKGKGQAIPLPTLDANSDDAETPDQGDVAAQLVEPGRALALADFTPPSLGAGERLIRLAYRMGIPGPVLTAPFASLRGPNCWPPSPIPAGGQGGGGCAAAGHFLVHGLKQPIAQLDLAGAGRMVPPLERMVHGFHWLADLEAAGPREQVSPVAERILAAG
jgi:hypothetical protein